MPTLRTQKLIPMGQGGLVVTIPKAWRDYYRLKAGDAVTVIANGELRISPRSHVNVEAKKQRKQDYS